MVQVCIIFAAETQKYNICFLPTHRVASANRLRCLCKHIALFMQTHCVVYAYRSRCLCLQIALWDRNEHIKRDISARRNIVFRMRNVPVFYLILKETIFSFSTNDILVFKESNYCFQQTTLSFLKNQILFWH